MHSNSSSHTTSAKRRILIVDNHPLVRHGLTALINGESDLTVCAAVATDLAGLEAIGSCKPDLVITDLSLEAGDSVDLVSDIHSGHEELPVLVFSMHNAPQYARRAFRAGANGYVTKQETGETLLIAIRQVLDGEKFVSPKINLDHDTS